MGDQPIDVVLVHWNRSGGLLAAIPHWAQQGVPVRLRVVDNGSSAEHLEVLRRELPGRVGGGVVAVDLVELGRNAGFGPGANAGLRAWLADPTGSAWAALAPHDAQPTPGCLATLLDVVGAEPMAGLACADVGDGATPVIDPYFGGILKPAEVEAGWEDADHPHGTLMLLGRSCVHDVGLFDERFFAYCEEADLALRARASGWRVGLVRGARVVNPDLGSTVPAVDYLQHRNTLLLVRELSGRYHAFIRGCFAAAALARGLARPEARPPVWAPAARVRGVADYLRGRFGPPPADLLRR